MDSVLKEIQNIIFKVKKLWNSLLLSISFSFEYKKIQESFKNF